MTNAIGSLVSNAVSSLLKGDEGGQEVTDFSKLMSSPQDAGPTTVAQASGLAGGPQMLQHLGPLTEAGRQAIFGQPGWIDGQRHLDAHIHYMKGSGAPMNVDVNALDFKHVQANDFPSVAQALEQYKGKPGTYTLPASSATVVPGGADAVWAGRLVADLAPGAKLTIEPDGDYKLDGQISIRPDPYNFDPGTGRKSPFAEASTWAGLLGSDTPFNTPREFMMNFVGTQNFDRNVVLTNGLNSGRLHGR